MKKYLPASSLLIGTLFFHDARIVLAGEEKNDKVLRALNDDAPKYGPQVDRKELGATTSSNPKIEYDTLAVAVPPFYDSSSEGISKHNLRGRDHSYEIRDSKNPILPEGTKKQDINTRIVGGDMAYIEEFPYYVSVGGCGGSLIAPNVVLTAAHCGDQTGTWVNVGAMERGSATTYGGVICQVIAEVTHPYYNADDSWVWDFRLLLLDRDVDIGSSVVLQLNSDDNSPYDGEWMSVMGLGVQSYEGDNPPQYLLNTDVQSINMNQCATAYSFTTVYTNQICTGVPGGGKGPCQGDSGGPLVIRYGNTHVQVGVVSWATNCADAYYPNVYARVSSAHGWIRDTVCSYWNGWSHAPWCG